MDGKQQHRTRVIGALGAFRRFHARHIAVLAFFLGNGQHRGIAAILLQQVHQLVGYLPGHLVLPQAAALAAGVGAAVAGVDCDYRQVLVLHGGKNLLCQRAALCCGAHHPRVGQNHPHSNGHQRKREEEHPCARVPLPAMPGRAAGRLLFSVNCHLFFLTTLWRPRIRLAVCVLPCRMRFCLIFNLPLPVMQGKCSRSWFHSIKRCSSAFCYNFCAEIFSY